MVGRREDGWTDLGECKWGAVRSGGAPAAELEAKVARYPNPRGATIGRRLFTRGKIKPPTVPGRAPARRHCLEDLYGAGR